MLQHKISGLPVVDGEGLIVGIVTDGDFLRRAAAARMTRPAGCVPRGCVRACRRDCARSVPQPGSGRTPEPDI
jgi:CBS-domain-containing membrane protein